MKMFIKLITINLAMVTVALANATEEWTIEEMSCSSGQLQPSEDFQVGRALPSYVLREMAGHIGGLVETESQAVISVITEGNNDGGVCANNDESTIFTMTLSKK